MLRVSFMVTTALVALVALAPAVRADDNEQCETVTTCGDSLCPQRLHLAAALIHKGPQPLDSLQLNLALRPPIKPLVAPSTEAFSVTLTKTNAPSFTAVSIAIPAGGLAQIGPDKYQFNGVLPDGSTTKITFDERYGGTPNAEWVVNLSSSPQIGVDKLTTQDLLALSVVLGPDTFIQGPIKWRKNKNGELVMPLDPCKNPPTP